MVNYHEDDDLIGDEPRGGDGRRLSRRDNQSMADHGIARDQLRAFIERIERLEEEKAAIGEDIKEVYAEAKGNGFDTKVMRQVIKIRKQDRNERAEQEAILDLYLHALGMIDSPRDYDEDE